MVIQQKLNHGGPRDLFVRPAAGGEPANLTANWDLDPGDSRWSADSRHLYFTAAIGGESHLFRVGVPAGPVEQLTKGPRRIGGLTYDSAVTATTPERGRIRSLSPATAGRTRRPATRSTSRTSISPRTGISSSTRISAAPPVMGTHSNGGP